MNRPFYMGFTEDKAMKILNELQGQTEKMKKYLKIDEKSLLGDMRTEQVRNENYEKYYKGKRYVMDSFTGFVKEIKYLPQIKNNKTRAKILMELKHGKRLSFFAWVDNTIKVNTVIEAVGICIKEGLFYNFKCYGGLKRVMTPMEFDQCARGKKFEDLKLSYMPLEILSEVKETKPMEVFEVTSLKEIFGT